MSEGNRPLLEDPVCSVEMRRRGQIRQDFYCQLLPKVPVAPQTDAVIDDFDDNFTTTRILAFLLPRRTPSTFVHTSVRTALDYPFGLFRPLFTTLVPPLLRHSSPPTQTMTEQSRPLLHSSIIAFVGPDARATQNGGS